MISGSPQNVHSDDSGGVSGLHHHIEDQTASHVHRDAGSYLSREAGRGNRGNLGMPLYPYRGRLPRVGQGCYVAPNASLGVGVLKGAPKSFGSGEIRPDGRTRSSKKAAVAFTVKF